MGCPTDEEIAALVEGKLPPDAVERIHRHADGCASCRQVIAAAARHDSGGTPETGDGLPQAPETAPDRPSTVHRAQARALAPSAAIVGRYRILEHLGSGGMGAVYAAYDPELDRRIALKLLSGRLQGANAQREHHLRLQREAQAMAKLTHPNVVSVHDVGTHEGRVFVAMELVEGQNLRQWLTETKRSWQEIHDAFVQAGRGLAAAHAVGLIHRDFKPDNVLIGKDGRVRVADFGLARAGADAGSDDSVSVTEPQAAPALRSPLTQAGRVLGTPRYMAPEQLRAGEADARSDQFSFGVALYESLCGVRAFPVRDLTERLERIEKGQVEPPPPGHGVPERVIAVARRAMSAAPEDRFPSMEALLDALTRDQRRRAGASVAAAVAVVLVAGIAGGSYVLRPDLRCKGAEGELEGVWDAGRREAIRSAFTASGAPGAEEEFERVATALDRYASTWTRMREEVCTAGVIRKERPEPVMALQMTCLELRLKELRALTSFFAGADRKLVGKSFDAAIGLSGVRGCGDVTALTDLAPIPEDPKARAEISALREELAVVNATRLAGDYASAGAKAAAIVDRALPLKYRPLEAEALFLKGMLEDQLGKSRDAEQTLVAAIHAAEAGRDDLGLVRAVTRLVQAASQTSRYEEGWHWAGLGLAALERIGGNPELEAELLTAMGAVSLAEGKDEQAAERYERARRIFAAELGPEHPKTLNAATNLANALAYLRRSDEAIRLLEDNLPLMQRVRGADHPSLIAPLWTLTNARIQRHLLPQAHASIDRALQIARARLGPEHVRVASCLELKATAFQEEGKYAEALDLYREALRIKEKTLGKEDPRLSFAYDGIGQCLLAAGRAEESLPVLKRALALRGPSPGDRADTQFALARAVWKVQRNRARAAELATGARDGYREAGRPDRVRAVEEWLGSL